MEGRSRFVARIFGAANRARTADRRHADARARPEDRDGDGTAIGHGFRRQAAAQAASKARRFPARNLAARGKVKVTKNRVQPANSLHPKCSVSRAVMGSDLVAVHIFSLPHDFRHGLLHLGLFVDFPQLLARSGNEAQSACSRAAGFPPSTDYPSSFLARRSTCRSSGAPNPDSAAADRLDPRNPTQTGPAYRNDKTKVSKLAGGSGGMPLSSDGAVPASADSAIVSASADSVSVSACSNSGVVSALRGLGRRRGPRRAFRGLLTRRRLGLGGLGRRRFRLRRLVCGRRLFRAPAAPARRLSLRGDRLRPRTSAGGRLSYACQDGQAGNRLP